MHEDVHKHCSPAHIDVRNKTGAPSKGLEVGWLKCGTEKFRKIKFKGWNMHDRIQENDRDKITRLET